MFRRRHVDEKLLAFIASYQASAGCPPSVREMAAALDHASTAGVRHRLQQLAKDGRITYTPGQHRTVQIVEAAD